MTARKRVALVTCEAFPDLYEDDLLLVAALADIGVDSTPTVWSDASIDWTSFDALVMRSPWDYFKRVAELRAWFDRQPHPRRDSNMRRKGLCFVPTKCPATFSIASSH